MKYIKREQVNWWMSYADLMSAIVMILLLSLAVVIIDISLKERSLQQAQVAAQKSQQEMLHSKQEVQQVIGLKSEIIKELSAAFQKSKMQIEIDKQTGAIRLPGSILFDSNSTQVSTAGQSYLQQFVPMYFDTLLQPKFKDQIAGIIIEGYTDNQGTYMYNMQLSQERAFSVLSYIYSKDFPVFPTKQLSQQYVTCDGWSYNDLLYNNHGQVDQNKSRRVEFMFQLKDDQALNEIQKLVNGQ